MIGKLKDRIEILNKTESIGDAGEATDTWSLSATVWAWVRQIHPSFAIDDGNRKNEKHYDIVIRKNQNIDITSKIRYNGQYMRVDSFAEVDNVEEFYILKCAQSINELVSVN